MALPGEGLGTVRAVEPSRSFLPVRLAVPRHQTNGGGAYGRETIQSEVIV
jgi:hypothetical protein